jgi:hypothetical protein
MGVKAKEYTIKGKDIELYTIGELADRLDRQRQTLRKWEKQGIIPQATYRSGSNRRLYSLNQISAIVETVEQFQIKQGQPIPGEFKDIVTERFIEATELDFQEPVNN